MAEQIPYGVASSLIVRLASAAFLEFGRIHGVMDELERLKSTIESIKAVLLDAEEKQEQDQAVQIWIRRLKDVLHHADDVLDEFAIEDMRHKVDAGRKSKVKEVFHSLSLKPVAFRRKMAHKIEKIRQNFNDVVQDMSKLNLSPRVVVINQSDSVRRETSSFVLESDIIGREDSKKEIINLLRQPNTNQNVSSIAIVGIGGLGKTALAQLVYNDAAGVHDFFEKRMWICVSDNFDVKTIVKKMLESLMGSEDHDTKLDKLSLDNLQNKLRENLSGKKYLLVLDDIWNESHQKWTQLRIYLMCGAPHSKILVTTRSEKVTQAMGVSVSYVLNGLNPEESWSLLKNITFGDDALGVNQHLESIGKKIAERCRGVPLAIRTLGGLLQSKSEESEWIHVLQGDFWKLCDDEDSITPVLKLSYQNLSPQLRQCFAYCSLYPKDWEIEKDELIQLWIAQGYLECSTENQLMEDVGNQLVKTFLMKSFFQDAKMSEHGEIVSFKMHDLMHDLAMLVAGNDCCYLQSEAKTHVGRPMHVSLEPNVNVVHLLGSLDASRLRTLILLSPCGERVDVEELSVVLSSFKRLRVLKLQLSSLRKLPDSIGKLKHLRYLNVLNCIYLESLSKCIGTLVCLQILKLDVRPGLEFSTEEVSKLFNLRHLYLSGCKLVGSGKMSARQYQGVIYSNWLSSFTNIVEISLSYCGSYRYLPPLERLPFLKSLEIGSLDGLECIHFEEGLLVTSFPSLERLSFWGCEDFKGWCKIGDDVNDTNRSHHLSLPSFPRLSQLRIIRCQKLTCIPAFPNLSKSLCFGRCPAEALEATINTTASRRSGDYCTPLSMLKSLSIVGYLCIEEIPRHWMQNLTSLEHLDISHFGSPKFQVIETWFEDDLNYLPSLQKITLERCPDLMALPDWMCNLSSLQHITVFACPNLKWLSERMPRLTNLHTLEIIDCPGFLIEEYQTETSPRRSHIAHIPNIIFKRQFT